MSPAALRQERESAPVLPRNTVIYGDCVQSSSTPTWRSSGRSVIMPASSRKAIMR